MLPVFEERIARIAKAVVSMRRTLRLLFVVAWMYWNALLALAKGGG